MSYGFFSLEQEVSAGSVVWVDDAGNDVIVTHVEENPDPAVLQRFPDMVKRGPVVAYVRAHKPPSDGKIRKSR